MQNPFKYGGIVSGPYFADRTEEIKELQREMENYSRVFLVSRRFGKTCLLHNLMQALTRRPSLRIHRSECLPRPAHLCRCHHEPDGQGHRDQHGSVA